MICRIYTIVEFIFDLERYHNKMTREVRKKNHVKNCEYILVFSASDLLLKVICFGFSNNDEKIKLLSLNKKIWHKEITR